jgi:hypothetical protein
MMTPSVKSSKVTNVLEALTGRTTAITNLTCTRPPVGCGKQITVEEMRSWSSIEVSEYRISGWCKTCQDVAFADPDDEDEELDDEDDIDWDDDPITH